MFLFLNRHLGNISRKILQRFCWTWRQRRPKVIRHLFFESKIKREWFLIEFPMAIPTAILVSCTISKFPQKRWGFVRSRHLFAPRLFYGDLTNYLSQNQCIDWRITPTHNWAAHMVNQSTYLTAILSIKPTELPLSNRKYRNFSYNIRTD